MILPAPDLPDDVDTLKAMIVAMAREQAANEIRLTVAAAEIARLQAVEKSANERIATLDSILKVLQRWQHGKRSERLRLAVNDEQVSFAFEEVVLGGGAAFRIDAEEVPIGRARRSAMWAYEPRPMSWGGDVGVRPFHPVGARQIGVA
jgi:hypothetical protein